MPPSRSSAERLADDAGSASLEFLTAGVLLLLPLIALVVALAAVQAGVFAVESAAAQAARVIAAVADPAAGREAAERAVAFALADQGFDAAAASVVVACEPVAPCPSRGGVVTVSVDLAVPVPLVPDLFGALRPSVVVSASATRPVSRFAAPP